MPLAEDAPTGATSTAKTIPIGRATAKLINRCLHFDIDPLNSKSNRVESMAW